LYGGLASLFSFYFVREELKSKNQAAHYFKNQKESEDEEQAVLTAYVGK
jgi:hypothetical protein